MHFLLIYAVVEHYVERRAEFRAAHLALARAARAFAQSDPYVQNGLVPH